MGARFGQAFIPEHGWGPLRAVIDPARTAADPAQDDDTLTDPVLGIGMQPQTRAQPPASTANSRQGAQKRP